MRKTFKYRLHPSKRQENALVILLDAARHLYNAALEQRRDAWKFHKISLNYYDQAAQLKDARNSDEVLSLLNYSACQGVLHRLQRSFESFFRRVKRGEVPGYPRFQGRDRFDSIIFPTHGDGVRLLGGKLRVQNVGEIRTRLHRPVEGCIKTVTLKREVGKWFVIFSCDQVPAQIYPETTAEVGIDMGLQSFATFSTGEQVENPRWYRKAEGQLTNAQHDLSNKKRNSNRRKKARARVARLHAKVANQRRDFQHKLSHRIVSENALIAVEDLAPGKMAEKSSTGLSKSIHDAAWATFILMLAYKAEEAGRLLVKVNPRGTSQTCSQCGTIVPKTLSDRVHRCSCGLVLDRDINASLNILRLGRNLQASA